FFGYSMGQRCVLFFFSSRRRHTRSLRDWSSDVCSSDLDNERRLWIHIHMKRTNLVIDGDLLEETLRLSGERTYSRAVEKAMQDLDRKSTRLNSSHVEISYAVFCLKKKKTKKSRYLAIVK